MKYICFAVVSFALGQIGFGFIIRHFRVGHTEQFGQNSKNKDITLIRNEIEAEGNDLRYIRTTDQATIRDKESFLNLLTTEGPLRKKGRTILSFDDITDGDSIECGGSRQVKLERTVQILNKSKMNMENSFELQGLMAVKRCVENLPEVEQVFEVFETPILQNIEAGYKTPDFYMHGIFTNKTFFEGVGDFKIKSIDFAEDHLDIVDIYRNLLLNDTTSVVHPRFRGIRVPTKHVLAVLGTNRYTNEVASKCRSRSVILMGPSGENLMRVDNNNSCVHLCV